MYQCWSLLILLKKLFNFSKEMGRVCVVQEAQETSWKLVLTESEQIKTGLLWHTAPSFLFYFNMLYCYCWFLMCERLTEKGEFGFWSALENRILEKPCNLERKQPPRLAAHWPQSYYWDFQNADEMAFAKILRTRIEMHILVYLMEHNVSLQRGLGCVSLLSCYGNTSPTQRIPCNFIPQYLMFLLSMFSLSHLLRINRPFLGYPTLKGHMWSLPKSPSLISPERISDERSCSCYKETTQKC